MVDPLTLMRTVFDHERDAPALDDAAALIDDLLRLDHEPAVTHAAKRRGP